MFFLSLCQQLFVFLADVLLQGRFFGIRPSYVKSFSICWHDTRLQSIHRAKKNPAVPPQADKRTARRSLVSNIWPIFYNLLIFYTKFKQQVCCSPRSGQNVLHFRAVGWNWVCLWPLMTFVDLKIISTGVNVQWRNNGFDVKSFGCLLHINPSISLLSSCKHCFFIFDSTNTMERLEIISNLIELINDFNSCFIYRGKNQNNSMLQKPIVGGNQSK